MKKFITIISALLFTIILKLDSYSQLTNGWVEQYVSFDNQLNDVKFSDINNGVVVGNNGIILKTNNSGVNWNIISSGTSVNLNSISLTSSSIVYIAGDSGIILRSTNNGSSWNVLNSSTSFNLKTIVFRSDETGFAAGEVGTLLRTTDSGNNWIQTFSDTAVDFNSMSYLNNNFIWAVGQKNDSLFLDGLGYTIKSTDLGVTWIPVVPKLQDIYYGSSIVFLDSLNGFSGFCSTVLDLGILKTTNAGINWECVGGTINCCPYSINFINSTTGFTMGHPGVGSAIFKTTDSGNGWYRSAVPFLTFLNSSFFVNNLTGWAAGNRILKTTNGGGFITNITKTSEATPSEFSLHQNYPNPFNPSTLISFDIPNSTEVKLIIYNSIGEELERLVDEVLQEGRYETKFDGSNYASGIYFYKLETEEYNRTMRMVLLK
ncbi:MAG: YCF48-related protein [Ignavibacteria bacterium]